MGIILANHDYHIVELNSKNPPAEMFEWLMLKFGAGNGERWFYKPPKLFFVNSADHLIFLLRWG
jgi:hypothetical protein